MRLIIQANIDRFTQMLETELDPEKRATVAQLLLEEKSKLETLVESTRANGKDCDSSVEDRGRRHGSHRPDKAL